jgi:hypothetical protein
MAKAAKSTSAPASNNAASVVSDFVDDLPAATRRGAGGFTASADVSAISSLSAPEAKDGGGFRYARRWYPVGDAPAEITGDAERAQWQKDEARKMTNRFSGIVRRIAKKNPELAFTVRTVEHNGALGVGVYRVNKDAA